MISIVSLWMPIVVSALFVFLVSSVMHMALKYHKADYRQLPDEARQIEALRGLPPGYYNFPYCTSMKDMGSPEMLDKFRRGPVGMLTVLPSGPPAMGKALGLWFVFTLVVGVLAGYLASRTLAPGTHYLQVFRVVGCASFMAYSLAYFSDAIWKMKPWGMTLKHAIDGLVYGLLTAGVFGWLWPQ